MSAPFTPQRLHEITDTLRGTTQSLPNVLNGDEDENSRQLAEHIDSELFECAGCGWWCGWDEQAADQPEADEPRCDECGAD